MGIVYRFRSISTLMLTLTRTGVYADIRYCILHLTLVNDSSRTPPVHANYDLTKSLTL